MTDRLKARIKNIKALVMDVDGILTNGSINIDEKGGEIKIFDVQDGFGIVLLQRLGFKTAIISARSANAVAVRATDLRIHEVFQDAQPKTNAYQRMLKTFQLKDEDVCFMGDDLPDLCVLQKVGFAVSVPNGRPEVKRAVHYVTKNKGGQGAVREVVELILKTQNKWKGIIQQYS